MPRKAFKVAIAAEPISFDIVGPIRGAQNFPCRDRLAAGRLMQFAELFSSIEEDSDNEEQTAKDAAKAIPAIRDFFNSALQPQGRDRFWDLINNDDEGIPLDTLVEIAGWLSEVYSGDRPTGETSSGTSEEGSPGDGSTVSYSRPDTPTPSASVPATSSIS